MIIIYIYVGSSDFSREVLTFIKIRYDFSREVLNWMEISSDFNTEVLKFMKISSDFSREVLEFIKISNQKHWVYDTWSAGGLYFARVFF